MVPGSHIDLPMVRFASWMHWGDLLENGVRIFEYLPTMLHNKIAVIDGIYSTIGSINFDARSMNANAEEALAFYDRGFAAAMEKMFQEDKKSCREITYAEWDERGIHRRIVETIFWIWEPYY
jgi:cardiolipin synthase